MINFEDLEFKPHSMVSEGEFTHPRLRKYNDAIHSTMKLENGYTISVVNGTIINHGNKELYELAFWNGIREMEVGQGYTKNELMEKINEINTYVK
jgi:hypothetical protein